MTEQTLSIETIAPRTPLQEFWFYFKQNKGAVIGLTFILAVALISILPLGLHLLTLSNKIVQPYCYHQLGMKAAIQLIYWVQMTFGRDILSRIIYGTRISVFAGFIIVILSAF